MAMPSVAYNYNYVSGRQMATALVGTRWGTHQHANERRVSVRDAPHHPHHSFQTDWKGAECQPAPSLGERGHQSLPTRLTSRNEINLTSVIGCIEIERHAGPYLENIFLLEMHLHPSF